jgi:hypothetical protein
MMAGPYKFLRYLSRVIAFLTVAIVASCSTKIWDAVHRQFPPLPRLLDGLTGNPNSEDRYKFTAKLTARFPVGTPEIEVMRALWLDGFQPMTGPHADPRTAVFIRFGDFVHDICRRDANVHWSADGQGRITAISGGYDTGCS